MTRRITLLALAILFTLSITSLATSAVAASNEPSQWAITPVNEAINSGLVPENLQQNYTQPISRGDVAHLIVNLIQRTTLQPIDSFLYMIDINPDRTLTPFVDTTDTDVTVAYYLGIINGVGNDRFDPDGTLTRAQMAAMINRFAYYADINGYRTDTAEYTHNFTDVAGHWSDPELGWPVHAGIIKGVSDNRFDPEGYLTMEQAIIIANRTHRVFWGLPPLDESPPPPPWQPSPAQVLTNIPHLSGPEVTWDDSIYQATLDYAATFENVVIYAETSSTSVTICIGSRWPVMEYYKLVFSNAGCYSTLYVWRQSIGQFSEYWGAIKLVASESTDQSLIKRVDYADNDYRRLCTKEPYASYPPGLKYPWE